MNLIHMENKIVYIIYLILFYVSLLAWIIGAIFVWPIWSIFVAGVSAINFAWWALMIKIDIIVENTMQQKINEIKK